MRIFLLCLSVLLLSLPTYAEDALLTAARMLDVKSGKVLESPQILVSGNRIKAINPTSVSDDVQRVELGDVTLMPGMVDVHVHLTADDANFSEVYSDNASTAVLKAAEAAKATLMAGFTSVRDVAQITSTIELVTVSLADAANQNRIPAPRIVAAGHALSISGGHIDKAMFNGAREGLLELDYRNGVADGTNEALKATRYQIKHGAKVIKISATAGVMSLEESVGAQQFTAEEMRVIVEEAGRHSIKVAAHAHGVEGIHAAVEAGVASIEHGSMVSNETMKLMKKKGTYLVPTTGLVDLLPIDKLDDLRRKKAEHILPLARETVKKAIKEDVKIALGSDAPIIRHGRNAYEAVALTKLGMSNIEAVRAATINGAELIGIKDIGELKVGYLADIIAVKGNPLEAIENLESVSFVMKDGIIYLQDPVVSDGDIKQ